MDFIAFIDRLEGLSRSNCNVKEIEAFLKSSLEIHPIPIVQINHPFLARARTNYKGEIFHHVSQLSYPPKIQDIWPQRANYIGQQVLYGALPTNSDLGHCQNTALLETLWAHVEDQTISRQYFTVGRWIINRPLNVCMLPFSPESCEQNDDFKEAAEHYKEIIRVEHSENAELFIKLLEYISSIYCKKTDKEFCYRISAAYFNNLKKIFSEKGKSFDGLIYPSANTGAAGMNIVLNKELVDAGDVTLDFVAMMALQRDPSNFRNIRFVQVSDELTPDDNGNFYFKVVF